MTLGTVILMFAGHLFAHCRQLSIRDDKQFVVPSHIITEDELMSSWISRKQDYTSDGIPHLTKIIRKPKGVGTEMKCLADGVVGIMLQPEICEDKEAESQKKWFQLPAGTAQTLRLSDPWHGSGRIVVADAAFSSVTTAIECRKKGLFYSVIVKTASREFPKVMILPRMQPGEIT